MKPLLSIQNLSKKLGNRIALNRVNLDIFEGEIVGLADRTGTAKATLVQILSGTLPLDAGAVIFKKQPLSFPWVPNDLGISIIYQDPVLVNLLDITSNIFLGNELFYQSFGTWLQIPNQDRMDAEAKKILTMLNVQLPSLHEKALNLSEQQRQLVAIAQVLARRSDLIVVDNVDDLLNLPYQEVLLDLIRGWQEKNTAVIFSSRNLDHLFAVCDRIIVLREGTVVANVRTDEITRGDIVTAMIGTGKRLQRTPITWAFDNYYQARKQAETLHHNQMLLKQDLAAQDSLNRELLEKLAEQVEALDSANLALQDAQRRLLTEREEERKRLARELHDQIIQDLLSLNYQMEEIAENASRLPELDSDAREVQQDIRHMVEDLRRICGDLRPPTIDSLGLGAALKSLARQWNERTGIEVQVNVEDRFGRLPEPIELSIFRIVQESLNNIWKHAQATEAVVSLQPMSPRRLLITIEDDGRGLDNDFDLSKLSQQAHFGLLGISERVALMDGRLNMVNKAQGGLLIQVELPHPRVEAIF